jgi:hypothetical protein
MTQAEEHPGRHRFNGNLQDQQKETLLLMNAGKKKEPYSFIHYHFLSLPKL